MLDAAARMRTLISDLLAYSQVATSAAPFVATDLAAIARDVVADLETSIAETGGRVEVGALPVIDADALQMRQLLQNLLGNALKFRRKDTPPVVRLGASSSSDGLCTITVTDNGIGFKQEHGEKIFRMFERLHWPNAVPRLGDRSGDLPKDRRAARRQRSPGRAPSVRERRSPSPCQSRKWKRSMRHDDAR